MVHSHNTDGQVFAYVRVSSTEQETARQTEALRALNPKRLYEDKASGKDLKRPALAEAMSYLRDGDTLAVHSLDRLARNLSDLLKIVDDLTAKGVTVRFLKENLIFTRSEAEPMSKLMLQMLGAFAEFERSLIRERQREGIAIAKKAGAFKGRKQSLSQIQAKEMVEADRANHGKKRSVLAAKYGISRATLYRYLGTAPGASKTSAD